jgi:transposase
MPRKARRPFAVALLGEVEVRGDRSPDRRRLDERREVFFHDLKRYRAIAKRFEKLARNFLALIHLACSILWLQDLAEVG